MERHWNNRSTGDDVTRRAVIFSWIDVQGPDDCWPWMGRLNAPKSDRKYGRTQFRGTAWLVHRAVYTLEIGEIPEGLTVDHLCFNQQCCNPRHLEAVPVGVNYERSKPRRRARAEAKTHCPRGHEFTPENTGCRSDGGKHCRQCAAERMRRRRAAGIPEPKNPKPACPRGHPLNGENLYVSPQGVRGCKECRREALRRSRRRRRASTP